MNDHDGIDPAFVAEAIRLKLIDPSEGDRYLRPPVAPKPIWLLPRTPPPPERLSLVRRPDGRVKRARARMTRRLLKAGVLDPDAMRAAVTPPVEELSPTQESAS